MQFMVLSRYRFSPMNSRVGVIHLFRDIGAGDLSARQLFHCLRQCCPAHPVDYIDGASLRSDEHALDNTALLCFGGGFDLGYLQSLGEPGCLAIRHYLKRGGRLLGICAGAYFASGQCQFDLGGPLEVCGRRFIGLFSGEYSITLPFPSSSLTSLSPRYRRGSLLPGVCV